MATSDAGSAWTAGQVARHLGIAESTLRSWHRRYGLEPSGSHPGHYRRYAPADVARLRRLLDLIESGMLPSEAARTVQADAATVTTDVAELVAAARALDSDRCRLLLDDALTRLGVVAAWDNLCRPALADVDRSQHVDPDGVDTEHVLSWAMQAALHRVARPGKAPDAPVVLLACAPDELHTLPLEALSAALAQYRVAVHMLGAATPMTSLIRAARATAPDVVVLWAQRPSPGLSQALVAVAPYVGRRVTAGPGWSGGRESGVRHVTSLGEALEAVLEVVPGAD